MAVRERAHFESKWRSQEVRAVEMVELIDDIHSRLIASFAQWS